MTNVAATTQCSVVILSDCHDSHGDVAIEWLSKYKVQFDHILMRKSHDDRGEAIVKQGLLNDMISCGVAKEQIQFVWDASSATFEMWKGNGIRVLPARNEI